MFTYEFEYTPTILGEKLTAKIEQDDEVINVTFGDAYLGSMVEDSNSPFGFSTDDAPLQDVLENFSMAYKEALALDNLPVALMEMYGSNILSWSWTDEKDLKIISAADTDLVDFAGVIKDQIYDVVLFDKPVIIYLYKDGSKSCEQIHVNS